VQLELLQRVSQETPALAQKLAMFGTQMLEFAIAVRVKPWLLLDPTEFV
jgi:hypothetical protein